MPKINVTKPFKYAYEGHRVVEYGEGEHSVPDECAEVALRNGWAEAPAPKEPPKEEEPPEEKGEQPEEKDAGEAPKNKSKGKAPKNKSK